MKSLVPGHLKSNLFVGKLTQEMMLKSLAQLVWIISFITLNLLWGCSAVPVITPLQPVVLDSHPTDAESHQDVPLSITLFSIPEPLSFPALNTPPNLTTASLSRILTARLAQLFEQSGYYHPVRLTTAKPTEHDISVMGTINYRSGNILVISTYTHHPPSGYTHRQDYQFSAKPFQTADQKELLMQNWETLLITIVNDLNRMIAGSITAEQELDQITHSPEMQLIELFDEGVHHSYVNYGMDLWRELEKSPTDQQFLTSERDRCSRLMTAVFALGEMVLGHLSTELDTGKLHPAGVVLFATGTSLPPNTQLPPPKCTFTYQDQLHLLQVEPDVIISALQEQISNQAVQRSGNASVSTDK